MTQQDFQQKAKKAAKEFANKKKVASQPETQFVKGALWAWKVPDALLGERQGVTVMQGVK